MHRETGGLRKARWSTEGSPAEGEVDAYRLAVRPGDEWMIETQAAILGTSRLYTLLVLRDRAAVSWRRLATSPRNSCFPNISSRAETFGDPSLGIRVARWHRRAAGEHRDLLGRGGPAFGYRLVARRQPADFILRLDDTHINIPRSGSASVSLTMTGEATRARSGS